MYDGDHPINLIPTYNSILIENLTQAPNDLHISALYERSCLQEAGDVLQPSLQIGPFTL